MHHLKYLFLKLYLTWLSPLNTMVVVVVGEGGNVLPLFLMPAGGEIYLNELLTNLYGDCGNSEVCGFSLVFNLPLINPAPKHKYKSNCNYEDVIPKQSTGGQDSISKPERDSD